MHLEKDTGGGGGADSGPSSADSGTGPVPDGGSTVDPQTMFTTQIEPIFEKNNRPKGKCVTCHEGANGPDGPDFLGPTSTSHYTTLISNPRYVPEVPANSVLHNHPDHLGNALCTGMDMPYLGCTEDESGKMLEWITVQAAAL